MMPRMRARKPLADQQPRASQVRKCDAKTNTHGRRSAMTPADAAGNPKN